LIIYKIEGIAIGVLVILGLFGPWISKGYDPYPILNPQTKQGELRYHKWLVLSPFSVTLFEDGKQVSTYWLISIGTFLSGLLFISSAIILFFRLKYRLASLLSFSLSFSALLLFFLSLGAGISVGLDSNIEWGFEITVAGVVLMFMLMIRDLIK
jgi:hypothetical protein